MKKVICILLISVFTLSSCSRKFTPTNMTPEQLEQRKKDRETNKKLFNTILLWNFIMIFVLNDVSPRK